MHQLIFLFVYSMCICVSVYVSLCLSLTLCVYPYIYMCVYPSIYIYPSVPPPPHTHTQLCEYIYELSHLFNAFYEVCPVLRAPSPELRAQRAALCYLTEGKACLSVWMYGCMAVLCCVGCAVLWSGVLTVFVYGLSML
jgi:hypothetical protein